MDLGICCPLNGFHGIVEEGFSFVRGATLVANAFGSFYVFGACPICRSGFCSLSIVPWQPPLPSAFDIEIAPFIGSVAYLASCCASSEDTAGRQSSPADRRFLFGRIPRSSARAPARPRLMKRRGPPLAFCSGPAKHATDEIFFAPKRIPLRGSPLFKKRPRSSRHSPVCILGTACMCCTGYQYAELRHHQWISPSVKRCLLWIRATDSRDFYQAPVSLITAPSPA
jgi:hypothetical protein